MTGGVRTPLIQPRDIRSGTRASVTKQYNLGGKQAHRATLKSAGVWLKAEDRISAPTSEPLSWGKAKAKAKE